METCWRVKKMPKKNKKQYIKTENGAKVLAEKHKNYYTITHADGNTTTLSVAKFEKRYKEDVRTGTEKTV